jgi:SAM-dependent methyltransferase
MNSNIEEYGEKYLTPDSTLSMDERILRIMYSRILDDVKGPLVLEMGVGNSVWTEILVAKFGHSHVVDAAKNLVESVVNNYPGKVTAYHSWFEEFSPKMLFDTVLSTMVLEHVKDPVSVLKKMKTWVKPNGQILIIVPNAMSLHRQYGTSLKVLKEPTDLSEADKNIGHLRVYTFEKLEEDVFLAGLEIMHSKPTFIKLLSNSQMKDFSQDMLVGLFDLASKLPTMYSGNLYLECRPAN